MKLAGRVRWVGDLVCMSLCSIVRTSPLNDTLSLMEEY
jgi:hypothetical protein